VTDKIKEDTEMIKNHFEKNMKELSCLYCKSGNIKIEDCRYNEQELCYTIRVFCNECHTHGNIKVLKGADKLFHRLLL
jgi:hypothetical protein